MNCEKRQDLMFEFVFGLLDESEANALREHVAGCGACAAELAAAKADQLKLACAALAVTDVAAFPMPSERIASETTPLPALDTSSQPITPKRRGLRPITIVAWAGALACCAVAAVFVAYGHRERIGEQESVVANLSRQHDAVEARLASLDANFALQQKQLPGTKDALQLHVAGPGQVTPGASAGFQVALRDLDGAIKPGKVDVEFLDDKNQSLAKKTYEVSDNTEIPVPTELAKTPGTVRMKVVGSVSEKVVGTVEESIAAAPSALAAHVAVNKTLYKAGDKLQLRALILDRATLKPAATGLKVGVSLIDEAGKSAAPRIELTTLAGMAAGEIVLPAILPDGNYVLEARGENLTTVRRGIEVLPAVAPSVELLAQKNFYKAGEPIPQQIQFTNKDGTAAANMQVISNTTIADQKVEQGPRAANQARAADNNLNNFNQAGRGYNYAGQTDAEGKLNLVIPGVKDSLTGRQQLNIEVEFGAGKKEKVVVTRELQVQPSRVVIDFYPEGGQLISGTANRVFYRVRAPEGAASASARFAVHSSKGLLFAATTESSVGSFSITPDAKETYTIKIASPSQGDVANPFAAHPPQAEGLMIRGATVQSGGGPLKLKLENRGPERLVQIVAMCRGQVVAHQRLAVTSPETPLDIATDIEGVLRVTAFDVKDGKLVPLTERLFFRPARRRLDVVASASIDKNFAVQLSVKGVDENRKPLAFWGLAKIVDDRFRGDVAEPSLSSHFLLLGDAPSDVDLSELPIVSLDGPTNVEDLELALGLFGWRRVSAANPELMAKGRIAGNADKNQNARPAEAGGASFFYRVEPSLVEVGLKLNEQWQLSRLALENAAQKQQAEFAHERSEIAGRLAAARVDLDELMRLPRKRMMEGLGLLALVLLTAGALGMVYGLARMVRRLPASGSFGVACGCLAACLALLVFQPQEGAQNQLPGAIAERKARDLKDPKVDVRAASLMPKNGLLLPNTKVALNASAQAREEPMNNAGFHVAQEQAVQDGPAAMRRVPDQGRVEQFARLDPTKQGLLRTLNEGEMKRGVPNGGAARDRVVVLENQQSAPGGFGGGGFGGGAPKVAPHAPTAGIASAQAPTAPASADAGQGAEANKLSAPKVAKGMMMMAPAPSARPPAAVPGPLDELAKKHFSDGKVQQRVQLDALTRQFVPRRSHDLSDPATLLWNPAVFVPAVGASMSVEVPAGAARYRVHIFGHTEDGRLGVYDGILNTK